MQSVRKSIVSATMLSLLCLFPVANASAQDNETLNAVREAGTLKCGASGQKPGLAMIAPDGSWSGFDVDVCAAIAAAVFGDDAGLEMVPTSWPQVFVSLQTGAVDVMNRNATYTIGRDTAQGFDFTPIFYSGLGFMVHADIGAEEVNDLAGLTFCVLAGSQIETVIAEYFGRRNLEAELVGFESYDVAYPAFEAGRCDVISTEPVGLVGQRSQFQVPEDFVILEDVITKEPIGPMVRHGDQSWSDLVRTVMYVLMAAEEFGITSENLDEMIEASRNGDVTNGDVVRLLGVEGTLGTDMGLEPDFAVDVIRTVGNYGEIWNRNFGPDTNTPLARGLNRPWTEGGLLYAPPFR